jgi:hypothetical protein
LQISSTGFDGSVGISDKRPPSWRMGKSIAPAATPVACSAGSRISISTALPDSNSARATSKVTASMLDAAPSQLTNAMALSDKNSPTWRLENSMEIPQ